MEPRSWIHLLLTSLQQNIHPVSPWKTMFLHPSVPVNTVKALLISATNFPDGTGTGTTQLTTHSCGAFRAPAVGGNRLCCFDAAG